MTCSCALGWQGKVGLPLTMMTRSPWGQWPSSWLLLLRLPRSSPSPKSLSPIGAWKNKVETLRDGLDAAVGGDKQALSRVFAANGCERIGRLRLVVDTVQLEVCPGREFE